MEEMSTRRKKGLRRLADSLSTMADRVRQVVKQTKTRVFEGITQMPGKVVSLFEPHTEIIRKEGQQANRVRQTGAGAGSRESDHHAL